MLTPHEIKQSIIWIADKGYSFETIADHYKLTVEQLKDQLRKGV